MYIRTGLAPISDESAHNQGKKLKILEILIRRNSASKCKRNRNTNKKTTDMTQ